MGYNPAAPAIALDTMPRATIPTDPWRAATGTMWSQSGGGAPRGIPDRALGSIGFREL